jgi:hypothetical protein
MTWGARKSSRITFQRRVPGHVMAIDGTWRRECFVEDVSDTGARLTIVGGFAGLNLNEFFLLLTPTGLVHRRCALVRVNGDQLGVRFVKPEKKKNQSGSKQGPE